MIVSWDWLNEYVALNMPIDALTERLTMAGLNLEETKNVGDDQAIDLEVTSNRPDCLGHIGVAREVAVLFDSALTIPAAEPKTIGETTSTVTSVEIECEDLCPRYIARIVRGVRIGPSPAWLQRRLQTVGIPAINNVADITNYVLMECGQPLHAFDFDKLRGRRIIVRRARRGETMVAINQRNYELATEMCVIADADRPVAIGGVMGGFETEIGSNTKNLLIETADFAPLSIRNTARQLNLHSESSYRFERRVDPEQLDWASRRCCELILDLAGGELLEAPVAAGPGAAAARGPITLRFAQIPRILGIEIAPPEANRILTRLGLEPHGQSAADRAQFVPPSWRRDLAREADLIEEVARIHGYTEIPDDASLPVHFSSRSRRDRVQRKVRELFTAAGYFEAVTMSFTSDAVSDLFRPRGERPKVRVEHSSRKHENVLRQSLIPSLLLSRRENERHGTFDAELFEIAKVYLEADPDRPENDVEPTMIGVVSGRSFGELKGFVESLAAGINHSARIAVEACDRPEFAPGRGATVLLNDRHWGWMGELERTVTDQIDLRDAAVAAELDLAVLEECFERAPGFQELPLYPAVERDLNFVLDDEVSWRQLEQTVVETAGPLLESVAFAGQYRGKQIAADKKSYVVRLSFRAADRTLTNEEVERSQAAVVDGCKQALGASLR